MSKWIDELTELICDTVRTVFPNASLDDGYDVADEVIAKLPTIEVGEEQLSKLKSRENSVENTTVSEDFTSISRANSKLEVSEDCISRAGVLEIYSDLYWMDERLLNFKDELDKVYEKLRNAPSVVPSEDCISREYMLRALNGYGKDWQEDCEIAETIRNAPSVVPSREEGEWIEHKRAEEYDGLLKPNYECSQCHDWLRERSNYCPNCGAKMRREK